MSTWRLGRIGFLYRSVKKRDDLHCIYIMHLNLISKTNRVIIHLYHVKGHSCLWVFIWLVEPVGLHQCNLKFVKSVSLLTITVKTHNLFKDGWPVWHRWPPLLIISVYFIVFKVKNGPKRNQEPCTFKPYMASHFTSHHYLSKKRQTAKLNVVLVQTAQSISTMLNWYLHWLWKIIRPLHFLQTLLYNRFTPFNFC